MLLGEKGPHVPYEHQQFYAFLGKVVGHTTTNSGDPALSIVVLDAWTQRQKEGQLMTIGVAQWIGCGLSDPIDKKPFQPSAYPVGTRLRVISREETMYTWDVALGITVLGLGTKKLNKAENSDT
mgnify:CR=1 FL=1